MPLPTCCEVRDRRQAKCQTPVFAPQLNSHLSACHCSGLNRVKLIMHQRENGLKPSSPSTPLLTCNAAHSQLAVMQGSWGAVCMQPPALPAPGVPVDRPLPGQLQLPGHLPPHVSTPCQLHVFIVAGSKPPPPFFPVSGHLPPPVRTPSSIDYLTHPCWQQPPPPPPLPLFTCLCTGK